MTENENLKEKNGGPVWIEILKKSIKDGEPGKK